MDDQNVGFFQYNQKDVDKKEETENELNYNKSNKNNKWFFIADIAIIPTEKEKENEQWNIIIINHAIVKSFVAIFKQINNQSCGNISIGISTHSMMVIYVVELFLKLEILPS